MIDEKKLIDDLMHNDGMEFEVTVKDYTPEAIANAVQEFANKMKEGFVALINAQHSFSWISTKEQLPKLFESVLINIPSDSPLPTVSEGYFTNDNIWMTLYGDAYTMEQVPYWMPMPEPPKGGET